MTPKPRLAGNARLAGTALAVLASLCLIPSSPRAEVSGCSDAASRQFDFWVGRWRVFTSGQPDKQVATSLIEKLYAGCAIRENWSPFSGHPGGSLSAFVRGDGGWRQAWADGDGSWAEFKGGWNGAAMVLAGVWPQPGHPDEITRMTYTPLPDGGVRQFGEASDDGGKTWQPSFDFTYRRDNARP